MLFNLGLSAAVGVVLVAFEWKEEVKKPLLDIAKGSGDWATEIIPITVQTPPEAPPPPAAPQITVIDNSSISDDPIDWDIHIDPQVALSPIELSGPPTVEIADEILDFSDVPAEFVGGMNAWYKYLKNNLSYPRQAQKARIEGTVFVRFVVNTDGSVEDVTVIRSVDPTLDQAAKHAVIESPRWHPARHLGKPVRVRMTIPIKFKLE